MSKKKPITITVYDTDEQMRQSLDQLGATYTERPVFSNFWGIQFTIERPFGKGSAAKLELIYKLLP